MNNQSLNTLDLWGRRDSEHDNDLDSNIRSGIGSDWEPPISYASQRVDNDDDATCFRSDNANSRSLHRGCMWDPQYPCQHGDWNGYTALGMSQPGYPFPNTAFDDSCTGQGYGGPQPATLGNSQPECHVSNTTLDSGFMCLPAPDHWNLNLLGTTPGDALGMDQDPFSHMPEMLYMKSTQFGPTIPPTTVPVPDAVAAPTVNDNSNRCTVCNRTFGRPQELRRHMGKHRSPKFRCVFFDCNRTFYRADKLRDHMRQGHHDALPF